MGWAPACPASAAPMCSSRAAGILGATTHRARFSMQGHCHQHRLETEAQGRQVAGAESLSKAAETHHSRGWGFAQNQTWSWRPWRPRGSSRGQAARGGWAAVPARPRGRGKELGRPGGGASRGRGREPVFVAPFQLHCNKSGVAAPPARTPRATRHQLSSIWNPWPATSRSCCRQPSSWNAGREVRHNPWRDSRRQSR